MVTRRDDEQSRQPRTSTGTGRADPTGDPDDIGHPDALEEAIRRRLSARRVRLLVEDDPAGDAA